MFYEYSINQWIQVGIYMTGMIVLFTGIYLVSTMCTNYLHKEDIKRNKLRNIRKERLRKNNKKKYFIDVA